MKFMYLKKNHTVKWYINTEEKSWNLSRMRLFIICNIEPYIAKYHLKEQKKKKNEMQLF